MKQRRKLEFGGSLMDKVAEKQYDVSRERKIIEESIMTQRRKGRESNPDKNGHSEERKTAKEKLYELLSKIEKEDEKDQCLMYGVFSDPR